MAIGGQHDPEEILHTDEGQYRQGYRPARNHPHFIGKTGPGVRIAKVVWVFHPSNVARNKTCSKRIKSRFSMVSSKETDGQD